MSSLDRQMAHRQQLEHIRAARRVIYWHTNRPPFQVEKLIMEFSRGLLKGCWLYARCNISYRQVRAQFEIARELRIVFEVAAANGKRGPFKLSFSRDSFTCSVFDLSFRQVERGGSTSDCSVLSIFGQNRSCTYRMQDH